MLVIKPFIFIILLAIAWQDFKYRAVYWWLFVVLMLGLGLIKYIETSGIILREHLFYNCSFLGVQLLFLSIYFSVKERKWVDIFKIYFGLGDLFFLLSITIYFSFLNYLVYYMLSLFAVIIVTLVDSAFVKKTNPKIPLAGEQAILLLLFMLVDLASSKINLTTDVWLINYFNL